MLDKKLLPDYQIPDLKDFKLKPYVSVHTPRLSGSLKKEVSELTKGQK